MRLAKASEEVILLNDKTLKLIGSELVLADDKHIVALAGIMGAKVAAVDETSQEILFESAYFDSACIAKTARHHQLHTEASMRFERGVDPTLCSIAIDYAAVKLKESCGAAIGAVQHFSVGVMPSPQTISFKPQLFEQHERFGAF